MVKILFKPIKPICILFLAITGLSLSSENCLGQNEVLPRFQGRPIPKRTKITTKMFRNSLWDYRKRMTLDAYQRYTRDSEKQKTAVLQFLSFYHDNHGVSGNKIYQYAKQAWLVRSQDPIYLTFYSYLLAKQKNYKNFLPTYTFALRGLTKHEYHPFFEFKLNSWRYLAAAKQEDKDKAFDLALDSLSVVLKDFSLQERTEKLERRFLWDQWRFLAEQNPNRYSESVINKILGMDEIDPWFKHMFLGDRYIQLAWKYRGDGFANTVTKEGWLQFKRYLKLAEKNLVAAWNLYPDHPESATAMITLAMAYSEHPLNERDWFDRVVSVQMDYLPAYRSLAFAMRPRWHGNYLTMSHFARECFETGRFDTMVPWQLYSIYDDIQRDLDFYKTDAVLWQNDYIFDSAKLLFESQMKWDIEHNQARERDYYYKLLAALSFSHGDMVLAEQYINKPTLMKYDDLKIFKIKDMKAFKALRKNKETMHDQLFRQR